MISLKLWRALREPPRRHPLFKRMLAKANRETPKVTGGFVTWGMMGIFFLFFFAVVIEWFMPFVLSMVVVFNTIYGLRWAVRIVTSISGEKQSSRNDLLALMPTGGLSTSWAISTGTMHQRSSFRWIPYLILLITIVTVVTIIGLILTTLALNNNLRANEMMIEANLQFIQIGIIALPFVVLIYIDHIYSTLTALLIGQLAVDKDASIGDNQVRGFLGFSALQIVTYTVAYGIAVVTIPALLGFLNLSTITLLVIADIIGIVIFVAIREYTVLKLWERLSSQLDAHEDEITLVLQPFYIAETILEDNARATAKYLDAESV